MNKLEKALVTGGIFIGGYLVGFYEWKYKTMKALTSVLIEKENEEKESQ